MENVQMDEPVRFTFAGALAGVRRTVPLALSDLAVGIIFGALAHQAGVSLLEALLMSSLVYAGSAQFVAVSLWTMPLPVVAIIVTTLVVNARYLLLGAALYPWFARLGPLKVYGSFFLLADENWALTIHEFEQGKRDAAFLVGSGLLLFISWGSTTLIGYLAGAIIQDPAQWGLDFACTAVFVALLTSMWKGKTNLLPWLVAAIVAIAAAHWLPGTWYILAGGLAGSIVGALTHADPS